MLKTHLLLQTTRLPQQNKSRPFLAKMEQSTSMGSFKHPISNLPSKIWIPFSNLRTSVTSTWITSQSFPSGSTVKSILVTRSSKICNYKLDPYSHLLSPNLLKVMLRSCVKSSDHSKEKNCSLCETLSYSSTISSIFGKSAAEILSWWKTICSNLSLRVLRICTIYVRA